jgi:ABC-type glycerol-3-phosphate transport system permease component
MLLGFYWCLPGLFICMVSVSLCVAFGFSQNALGVSSLGLILIHVTMLVCIFPLVILLISTIIISSSSPTLDQTFFLSSILFYSSFPVSFLLFTPKGTLNKFEQNLQRLDRNRI